MTSTPSLYRQAVAYAVERFEVDTDPQQIEWELLNLDQFKPLTSSLDADVLYDCIAEIMAEADAQNEDRLTRNIQPQEDDGQ